MAIFSAILSGAGDLPVPRMSAEELEHARRVLESYEAAVARGQGATSLGNEMVDLATARRAEWILGHGGVRTR